jgi:SPP1 family predicted phage head-tail adaptor
MKCCKYKVSDLRHRIEFQSLSLAANDSGGQTETWTTVTTVWSILTPKIVKEVNFAQRIEPRIDHDIVIRYYAGITTSMRIKFGTRYFEIKAVIIEDEDNEWMKILASERTGT